MAKTFANFKAQHLTDSFLSLEARKWINAQNDKEFVRRNLDDKREVFFYSGRAGKLNSTQMETFNQMHPHGWQAMGVAQRATTNEFVLVCRGEVNGMFGVVYPDGTIERSASRVEFKGSRWTPEVKTEEEAEAEELEVAKAVEAASTGVTPMVIPQAVEQFPSHAKGVQWEDGEAEQETKPAAKLVKRLKVKAKAKPVKAKVRR